MSFWICKTSALGGVEWTIGAGEIGQVLFLEDTSSLPAVRSVEGIRLTECPRIPLWSASGWMASLMASASSAK